jgi:hypothetical protein
MSAFVFGTVPEFALLLGKVGPDAVGEQREYVPPGRRLSRASGRRRRCLVVVRAGDLADLDQA